MSVLDLPILIDHQKIAGFCKARGIRKMSLFGSVLRPDFDPATSDVDVYAEFQPGALNGIGLDYFGYGDELALIFGRIGKFVSCGECRRHEGDKPVVPTTG